MLYLTAPDGTASTQVLRLSALHRQVLRLLGPAYENRYLVFVQSATCGPNMTEEGYKATSGASLLI